MSTASTALGLPFLKSTFTAPAFTSGADFNYILANAFNIPVGNYLTWLYLEIEGNTDTDLGPVITLINNGTSYTSTFNQSGVALNNSGITFQNSQFISITTAQPNLILRGAIGFGNTRPTVTGTIIFYPI